MNWKKILAAGALTAAAAALLVGCGTDNSSQAEQKLPDKIVIGLDDNFPPMGRSPKRRTLPDVYDIFYFISLKR